MTNEKFKQTIIDMGIKLNGLFCGYDVVINKNLELTLRLRKVKHKPNLKVGEVPVIKAIDFNLIVENITKDAIDTVLALHDILDNNVKYEKIKEFDLQIKHQIELTKYAIIAELIKEITPIKQTQIYYQLGIKNAEQLVSGDSIYPIY